MAAAQSASEPGDIGANVARHARFCDLAADRGVQLIVFPELSLTGYELAIAHRFALSVNGPELSPLRRRAERTGMTVVAGAPTRNAAGDLHIAAFVLRPDGSVSTYLKEHVHQSEQHVFASGPGDGQILRIGDATVALAICADATFPDHAARAAARGATVYAAGVMIDQQGYARKAWLLSSYAAQHRMAVLMANYSGISGGDVAAGRSTIWAEDGRVVAATCDNEEALIIAATRDGEWNAEVLPFKSASL